jgi:hypothetical protein
MAQAKPTIVELDMNKLEEILRRLDAKELDAADYETIKAVVGSYVYLVNTAGEKETTIRRLRQMLFGAKTEKIEAVIGGLKDADRASASPEVVPKAPEGVAAEAQAGAPSDTSVKAATNDDSQTSGERIRTAATTSVPTRRSRTDWRSWQTAGYLIYNGL